MLFINKSINFRNFFKFKRKLQLLVEETKQQFIRNVTTANDTNENKINILFFGTDNFSLPSLKTIHSYAAGNNNKLGTVTSFKSPANCIKTYAEQENLTIYRWPVSTEICNQYDLGIVVSFGHLISQRIIQAFPLGMINVHASLLPCWRGAAPIIYAIMNGDKKTGVSIMKIEPKHFDIGDILAQQEVSIGDNTLMPELHTKLANLGADLLLETIKDYANKSENAWKQSTEGVSYAPKITNAIIEINWSNMTAEEVFNRFRALHSFKLLNTRFLDKNVQLLNVRIPGNRNERTKLHQTEPGTFIYQRQNRCLLVQCAKNTQIEVNQLRVEGRKIMNALDFNNGFIKNVKSNNLLFSNKIIVCN